MSLAFHSDAAFVYTGKTSSAGWELDPRTPARAHIHTRGVTLMPDARKWSVATEWHSQQSPAVRDSGLTLPLLASLRDPAIAPHQALRPPASFTPTHTGIACWATARGRVGECVWGGGYMSSHPELNEVIGGNHAGINGPGLELCHRHATLGQRRASVKWTVTIRPQPDRERLPLVQPGSSCTCRHVWKC